MAPISLANHQKTVKSWLEWASDVGIAPEGVAGPYRGSGRRALPARQQHQARPGDRPRAVEGVPQRVGPRDEVPRHARDPLGRRLSDGRRPRARSAGRRPRGERPGVPAPAGHRHAAEEVRARRARRRRSRTDDGVIGEWIDYNRPSVRDEYGRQPLLATSNGRVALSTLRDWSYFATVPCRVQDCPAPEAASRPATGTPRRRPSSVRPRDRLTRSAAARSPGSATAEWTPRSSVDG